MNRFALIVILNVLTAWVAAAEPPRTVLFIAIDDLRPEAGCYGGQAKTPNIDRIAARGVTFTRAYCQQALCGPSRASLLTGLYPTCSGIETIGPHIREVLPDVVTLPQHFKNHGWHTASFGKISHNGQSDAASWSVPHVEGEAPRYGARGAAREAALVEAARAAGKDVSTWKKQPRGPAFEIAAEADDALRDGANAAAARAALAAAGEKPFFLAVGFLNPHLPYVAPKRYWDLYDPTQLRLPAHQQPPVGAPAWAINSLKEIQGYDGTPQGETLPESYQRQLMHGYLAATSYVDAQIGLLLEELERSGRLENTLIVLWGDNGYQLGEHGFWSNKHTNYESSTRVPLIISAPGLAAGRRCEATVGLIDLYPTMSALAALPTPPQGQGRSLLPLLEDPARAWEHPVLTSYLRGDIWRGRALRNDAWRLVEWTKINGSAAPVYELYDQLGDPGEDRNLAGDPRHAATQATLAKQLTAAFAAVEKKPCR
jgi:arylsulfatase A-like enzyme